MEYTQDRIETLRVALQGAIDVMQSTEDSAAIREIIRDADVSPDVFVGDPPESFDGNQAKTTEYVLGQWASGIDDGTPFLNTFRNVTLACPSRSRTSRSPSRKVQSYGGRWRSLQRRPKGGSRPNRRSVVSTVDATRLIG